MNNKLKFLLQILGTTLIAFTIMAPTPPPGSSGPIDGGASALVISSAYFGYKMLKAKRKEKEERKAKGE